jgi:hypothetical protein
MWLCVCRRLQLILEAYKPMQIELGARKTLALRPNTRPKNALDAVEDAAMNEESSPIFQSSGLLLITGPDIS